jgi:hypothetical protein
MGNTQNKYFKDPKWIKTVAEGLLDINIDKLSDKQKKMLRDLYLEKLRDGLEPKEAMEKAYGIVSSFNI